MEAGTVCPSDRLTGAKTLSRAKTASQSSQCPGWRLQGVWHPNRPPVRICIVYDCLFPYTVGGAEAWYRNVAQRLAADGHDVTYLTLRQWEKGERGEVPGVRVVTAGPRFALYGDNGNRRVL